MKVEKPSRAPKDHRVVAAAGALTLTEHGGAPHYLTWRDRKGRPHREGGASQIKSDYSYTEVRWHVKGRLARSVTLAPGSGDDHAGRIVECTRRGEPDWVLYPDGQLPCGCRGRILRVGLGVAGPFGDETGDAWGLGVDYRDAERPAPWSCQAARCAAHGLTQSWYGHTWSRQRYGAARHAEYPEPARRVAAAALAALGRRGERAAAYCFYDRAVVGLVCHMASVLRRV